MRESSAVVPGGERKLRELMTSKIPSEAYSPSGRHGGAFPSSTPVALASTAAAAAADNRFVGFIYQASPIGYSLRETNVMPFLLFLSLFCPLFSVFFGPSLHRSAKHT